MTRTTAREIAIHCAYSYGFSNLSAEAFLEDRLNKENFLNWAEEHSLYREYPNENQVQYIRSVVRGVSEHGAELDDYISRYSRNWQFSRIPLTAAAIMRVAMYEILYMPDIPNSSAINDAVEIAKKYEDQKIVSFINGILGSFVRSEFPEEAEKKDAPSEAED